MARFLALRLGKLVAKTLLYLHCGGDSLSKDGAMNPKIVLVEDEADISVPLSYSLRSEGYQVQVVEDGAEGLSAIRATRPQLVILDLMLPGMDGFEVCRQLRFDNDTKSLPIVMLTAKDDQSDVILGLGLGADDYVTKPFSTPQLIARIKAVLSRGKLAEDTREPRCATVGDLVVDMDRFEAAFGIKRLNLTATEFRILFTLACRPDCVYRRDELLNKAIGEGVYVIDRNIDVHIRSIRKKVGRHQIIKTVRGIGYRLESAESRSVHP